MIGFTINGFTVQHGNTWRIWLEQGVDSLKVELVGDSSASGLWLMPMQFASVVERGCAAIWCADQSSVGKSRIVVHAVQWCTQQCV